MNRTFAEMIENAADALDGDGADHFGKAVRQLVADNKVLRYALESAAIRFKLLTENRLRTDISTGIGRSDALDALAATDPNRIFEE